MKRKAFLIESAQLQGQDDLPGARIDISNWKNYLLSDEGGAWEPEEIQTFSKPSRTALLARLAQESLTDYVFIAFSGHGFHIKGKDLDESMICLNDTENVPVNAMNPGNPRCSFVIDTCRELLLEEAITTAFAANEMIRSAEYRDRAAYRGIFDAAVQMAERGIIRLFACDVDEAAGESPRSGGFYTTSLIRCCIDWHHGAPTGASRYYSTSSAHSCAAMRTTQRQPQQHPQYNGGRRNNHFPLAVKP